MIRISLQRGYLMIVAVALILIIGVLGVASSALFTANSRANIDQLMSTQAFYIAESGLEAAAYELLTPVLNARGSCASGTVEATNIAVGEGAYTVTVSGPTYATGATLTTTVSASATTILVTSTTGYDSAGQIMIDRERMNYTSTNSTNFLNVTRAVSSTTATAHVSGAPVAQYGCSVSSQGGVPSLTFPTNAGDPYGKRTLGTSIGLQDAWIVGNASTGAGRQFTVERWNRPTEQQWNNASFANGSASHLLAVSMMSYADGWAVGDSGSFLHWNGTSWTLTTVSPIGSYYGVYCLTSNNCIAVGDRSGGPVIQIWNGSTWTRIIPSGAANNNLRAVHCSDASNCWVVGASSAFYQWNGFTWSTVNVSGLNSFTFNSVFCNSSTDCWAVGSNSTFARKNGASWTNFVTGLPPVQYNSVFCNSSTDCWAVGDVINSRVMIAHWNGTSWSRDASNPLPATELVKVTCANTNDCWAIGGQPFIIHYDGTSWTTFSTAGLPSRIINDIDIISPKGQVQTGWQETFP